MNDLSGTGNADALHHRAADLRRRFRELFVISRNSAFVYKGKPINALSVANELGVQYVA